MSDKAWDKINPLDKELRGAFKHGMFDGTRCVIWMISGFELFNTRPYHNYENWAQGYCATDGRVFARAEDLDDCIAQFIAAAALTDEELAAKPWVRATEQMREKFGPFVGVQNQIAAAK